MYLARIEIKSSRLALGWVANRYRVHQRLRMAYPQDPRLLFRVEEDTQKPFILIQSSTKPDWLSAFADFDVLEHSPELKEFSVSIQPGYLFHFRLLANPTVTRAGKRLGLLHEEEQLDWINRQMQKSGAQPMQCTSKLLGFQRSGKNPYKDPQTQTHLAVQYDGILKVLEPANLSIAIENGIGPAKAYGFGLLSLAPLQIQD